MLVVTGASGAVGRLTAEALLRRGEPLRLLTRDPGGAPRGPGVEVVVGTYDDPAALDALLHAGDRVFMVSMHAGVEERLRLHGLFVEAARRARVAHVTYLSFVNASREGTFVHQRSHRATEELLSGSGIPFTAMRNGMYAEQIPWWFGPDGVARGPGGDGRTSFTYRPELAEAIAVSLTRPGHAGKVYDIVTPESVTLAELAALVQEATGRPHRYEPGSRQEYREARLALGREPWDVEAGLSSFDALATGELDVVSDDFRTLTGLDPLSLREIVQRL